METTFDGGKHAILRLIDTTGIIRAILSEFFVHAKWHSIAGKSRIRYHVTLFYESETVFDEHRYAILRF